MLHDVLTHQCLFWSYTLTLDSYHFIIMSLTLPFKWEEFIVSMVDELDEIILILRREMDNGIIIFPTLNNVLRVFYETP